MNKLLTYAGTQPIYLGDIDFVQNAASEVFTNIAKALMNLPSDTLNGILQGVDITRPSSGNIAWSAGVVVLNGEILPIAAGSITADSESELYFHSVSILSGARTFKDEVSRQCYDTRSATLSTESTGGVPLTSVQKFHAIEYAVCVPYSTSSNILSGRLVYKNGFWGIEASLEIQDTSIANSLLFNISEELLSLLPFQVQWSFLASICLYTDKYEVLPARVSLNKPPVQTEFNLSVEISILSNDDVLGSGDFKAFVPLFNI